MIAKRCIFAQPAQNYTRVSDGSNHICSGLFLRDHSETIVSLVRGVPSLPLRDYEYA